MIDRRQRQAGAPPGTEERRRGVFQPTITAGAVVQALTVLGTAVSIIVQTSNSLQAIRDDFQHNNAVWEAQERTVSTLLSRLSVEHAMILQRHEGRPPK